MSDRSRIFSVIAVFGVAAACSGKVVSGGGTGGSSGSGGAGASSGTTGSGATGGAGGSSATGGAGASDATGGSISAGGSGGSGGSFCPTSPPDPGTLCPFAISGTTCTYGDSVLPGCREHWKCNLCSGPTNPSCAWVYDEFASTCGTVDGGSCPTTAPVASSDGGLQACDAAMNGAQCGYPDGTICVCSSCLGNIGPCQYVDPPRWECTPPPTGPGCPPIIPNAGTSCSDPSFSCVYAGSCGVKVTCEGGYYVWMPQACPV